MQLMPSTGLRSGKGYCWEAKEKFATTLTTPIKVFSCDSKELLRVSASLVVVLSSLLLQRTRHYSTYRVLLERRSQLDVAPRDDDFRGARISRRSLGDRGDSKKRSDGDGRSHGPRRPR